MHNTFAGVDIGTITTTGDDQGLHLGLNILLGHAGAFLHHLPFVVIYRDPTRLFYETTQVITVKHWHALTRVKDEWNTGIGKLLGMLDHAVTTIRRNNTYGNILYVSYLVLVGEIHR